MADSKQAPLDAAAAAKAAFASVQDKPFPDDIFTAPELRWAVIGCGVIANQMAQSLALAGRKLAGVANRTLSKAQAFADQYGIEKVYDTVEDLYADPNIDAVYITTPHNTHITYLRAALAAGKHVLCEKAITLNSSELDEARAIADEHNVVLMDATTVLHMPLYQELRRRMDAGEFGCMNLAQLNFGSYKEYGDLTNRFYNRNLAGGAMLDIGVYALSVMRLFMASQPAEVVSLGNTCCEVARTEQSELLAVPECEHDSALRRCTTRHESLHNLQHGSHTRRVVVGTVVNLVAFDVVVHAFMVEMRTNNNHFVSLLARQHREHIAQIHSAVHLLLYLSDRISLNEVAYTTLQLLHGASLEGLFVRVAEERFQASLSNL